MSDPELPPVPKPRTVMVPRWTVKAGIAALIGCVFLEGMIIGMIQGGPLGTLKLRAQLGDLEPLDRIGLRTVGECFRDSGFFVVLTREDPARTAEIMHHEYFHCVVSRRLSRAAWRAIDAAWRDEGAPVVASAQGATSGGELEEWAADQWAACCLHGCDAPEGQEWAASLATARCGGWRDGAVVSSE